MSNLKNESKVLKDEIKEFLVAFFIIISLSFIVAGMYKLNDYLNPKVLVGSFYTVNNKSASYQCYKHKWDLDDKSISELCDSKISCRVGIEYLNGFNGGLVQLNDKYKNPIQCVYTAK